ncbi:helix-turn-helix domain-containing protein [Streptomyces formicae]
MRIRCERLLELRTRHQMTQSDVAKHLGCSRAAVSTWETTGHPPKPATIRKLATLYGVSVFYLIDTDLLTLKVMRSVTGMRQRDVAELLGVCPSRYCDVETRKRDMPARWVPILSRTFCLPLDAVRRLAANPPGNESGGDTGN